MEVGKVCQDCNGRLGSQVDQYLKTENFMMMKQYQDSSEVTGKIIGKVRSHKDRIRKEEERYKITGYAGKVIVERDLGDSSIIKLKNLPNGTGGDFSYSEKFSRALHKCAVNVLLDSMGRDYLKNNHAELIDFVNNGNHLSNHNWSYAVCYSNIFSMVHFEPFCLQQLETIANINLAVVLIFPCAIFIVCTQPGIMTVDLLKLIGNQPPIIENWNQKGFDYVKNFQSTFKLRKTFGGKLKFVLVEKTKL